MNPQQLIKQVQGRMRLQYPQPDSLLLQCMIALQSHYGGITSASRQALLKIPGVSVLKIDQLIDFYSFLHASEAIDYRIYVSDNIIDQYQGSEALYQQLVQHFQNRSPKKFPNRVVISKTSCIGLSDQGPALLINGYLIARVDAHRLRLITDLIEQDLAVADWPEELLHIESNIQKRDYLLNYHPHPGISLQNCLGLNIDTALQRLSDSNLRGRGGAGFPTAKKWQFCRQTAATSRAIVCNADEGEPGTFKDRVLLREKPDLLIDGMLIAAHLCNADKGFIYLRGEYQHLLDSLLVRLQNYRKLGLLGKSIAGIAGFDFDIDIHLGAGAYICGEESALIESLESKPGVPRNRPPYPVNAGYMGLPTVVNNVETLVNVSMIFSSRYTTFNQLGTSQSHGSKLLSISGDCQQPGVYEVPLGISIKALLKLCKAEDTAAVQVGGAAGHLLGPDQFDRQISFEDAATAGAIMIFSSQRSLLDIAANFAAFFVHESCGFCTPCRVGTQVQLKILQRLKKQVGGSMDIHNLQTVCNLMQNSSHCGLGSSASWISESLLKNFAAELGHDPQSNLPAPLFDIETALAPARQLAGRL